MISSSGISVVMCCYNSAKRLPTTLHHLSNQRFVENISVELIVVNNNSSDETARVAFQTWKELNSPFKIKVVDELRSGLSFAREKGFEIAQYDYILLCDDDNWLEENYLQRAFEIMQSDKSIGALGGKSSAVFEVTPPKWYDSVKGSYAVGEQMDNSGPIPDSRGYLWGAGLVIRREALQKLYKKGFKSILSDRKGRAIMSGGDGEICAAIRLIGYTLYYHASLKFQHYMTRERLTWPYYLKLLKSFGQARVYLGLYDYVISKKRSKTPLTPEEYWDNTWIVHKKAVLNSKRKLLQLWFIPREGQLSIINLQMKIGGVLEMLKVRKDYLRHIDNIYKTFL